MSGLLAVVAVDRRRPVTRVELEEAVEAFSAVVPDTKVVAEHGNDLVRAALLAGQPAGETTGLLGAGDSWHLVAGTAFDRDGSPPQAGTPLSALDGQFAAVSFDATRGRITAATDPLGMTPLFVARRGGRAYVSTSSIALARIVGARPERQALQAFLLSGFHFGAGCHWQGVTRLDPGHAARFGPDGERLECYWRPELDDAVARLPFRRAVDHAIDVAVESYRVRLTGLGETWVDLTGGYDSRLLALLLRRAGIDVRANTRHTTNPADVQIAEQVAARLGIRWQPCPLPREWPDLLPRELATSLAWGDANLEVLQLSRVLWVHRRLAHQLPGLLSAGGGEHLQYAAWKSEFTRAGRSTTVHLDDWIDMRMLKPVDRSVLRGDPVPAVREDYRARLSRWIEPYSDEVNTTQLDMLYAYKSTGHFGAYRAADEAFLRTLVPLYFRDVFTTAVSTDFRYRNNHRLMRHMVQRLDPSVAALPTTRGGPAQPWGLSNLHRFLPYYAQLGRKAVTKLSGKLLDRPLLLARAGFPWSASAHTSVLGALAASGAFRPDDLRSASLYEPRRLRDLLDAATRPGFGQHPLLGRVITVELALRAARAALD